MNQHYQSWATIRQQEQLSEFWEDVVDSAIAFCGLAVIGMCVYWTGHAVYGLFELFGMMLQDALWN